MKKILLFASALAGLFLAASCQRENLEPVQQGGTVTYTVQVPGALATKAAGDYELIYEVYREAQVGTDAAPIYEGKKTFSGNSVDLPLEFVKGQNFVVLFWAQKDGVTAYNTGDLRNVTLGTLTANQENYEVFAGMDEVSNCVSSNNGNVELVRPIAQLNIATDAEGLKLGATDVNLYSSFVTVKGLSTTYNVYNKAVSETLSDVEFSVAAVPAGKLGTTDYTYVAMNYIGFIDANGTTVNVDFTVKTSEGDIAHSVSSVPVKPNYKTNIIGNLITETDNYQVTLGAWGTPDTNVEVVAVSTAQDLQEAIDDIPAGTEGNITLTDDIDLSALASMISTKAGAPTYGLIIPADKSLVLDLNGNTLAQTVNCTASYSMIENHGSLTIIDSKGEGKISFKDTGAGDPAFGWGSYTIFNYGNLVVNSGTIEHTGEQNSPSNVVHMYCAIQQNNANAVTTINGGTISTPTYRSIRINSGSANFKGGVMDGQVWVQPFAEGIVLNIEGGSFEPNGGDGSSVFVTNDAKAVDFAVTGGFFATKISCSVPANLAGAVTGGTFTESAKANTPDKLYAGYYFVQDGENYVLEQCPVKIGETAYDTLADAVAAVQEGETITILAGKTLEEGTVKLPAALKNVTFKGEEGATLKDMTISAADGNAYSYQNLKFDGLTFDNSRILLTGWRNGEEVIENLTVTNCTFQNLFDTTNSAPVHINKDASEAVNGFTFTNNVIDGATGGQKSGVYAQVTGNVVFTDNVINNVSFRPYVIQVTTDDNIADNFVVTNNTFSGSAAGRAQGLGNNAEGTDAVNIVISENIFKGITDAQQICYWNFNPATTTADLSHNYYDIDILVNPGKIYYNASAQDVYDLVDMGVFPIYTDAAKTTLYTPEVNSAKIGETEYATLQEAVAAAKAGDTITVLCKVDYSEELVLPENSSLEIKADANIKTLKATNGATIIIEDGKTLTLNNFSFGSSNNSDAVYEIKGGTVTANYGFFQYGTYALRSNFETGYMYYSYGSNITVYGTFHSQGVGDGLDYVRGNLTIAKGGKSIHEKSLWVGQPASWGAMEASLTIEDGGYVQANNLCVYEGSSLTYYNNADLKYNNKTFEGTITAPQQNNEIWYTATAKVEAHYYDDRFGEAQFVSNVWDDVTGKGVITFDAPLTKVGTNAFYEREALTSVSFPNSVTEIGNEAFKGCRNLTSVEFGSGIKSFGEMAFQSCGFTSLEIPEGVTTIGNSAFNSCTYMTSVVIPSTVTEIGNYAFNGCPALTGLTIPEGVTYIGYDAFASLGEINVYLKPSTPPTILGNNPFGWGTIYVPSASLDAYKTVLNELGYTVIAE